MDFKWSIKWNKKALDDLKKIDESKAKLIKEKVEQYLVRAPLELGEKMQHIFKGFYRYRVGSYQNITASKIILFGSRARNDFNKDSDWDRHIASDIIIRSQSEIQKFSKRVNSVTKTAIEEGVPL